MLKSSLLLSGTLFFVALIAIFIINPVTNSNEKIHTGEYCEVSESTTLLNQPINTISNFGYFFVGSLIIFNSKKKSKSFISQHRAFSIILGITAILIGVTSMLFHGIYEHWTKTLDSSFVFIGALMLALALYRISIESKLINRTLWYDTVMILIACLVGFIFLLLDTNAIYLVVVIIVLSIFIVIWEYFHNIKFNQVYIPLALGFLIGSFVIRQLEVLKIICYPNSLIQLHGIWHIGTAISYWYFYKLLYSAVKTVKIK